MNYAHWRKCDFQIHSPRDPNWIGNRPVGLGDEVPASGVAATAKDVDAARMAWAASFVDKCSVLNLGAVAITDHHEMVMVSYVRKEIASRKEHDNAFDLWLFPGMELTATGGKQCLILFDADLHQDWWQQAQGQLGIAHAALDTSSSRGAPVIQLNCAYPDIAASLDRAAGLRGKYIILPNISQGGRHTVLVDGHHADFRRMQYVGGYMDGGQNVDNYTHRYRERTSGQDATWSTREIYPIPTSDSRRADFADLGTNSTWIKLAEPTAEAIRQAFLGHRSRISIEAPMVPSLFVSTIKIEGSAILKPTELDISPELNSAIGGRGSGKSSFLEYLSFGLGRSCHDFTREHYSGNRRLADLVNDTIVAKNGRVTLSVMQDNAEFSVMRGPANSYQPEITYPDGTTQVIAAKELRSLFPAVVYSQGELAEIGKQTGSRTPLSDLLQFVNPDYKREDDRLSLEVDEAKNRVKEAIRKLTASWSLRAKLRKLKTEQGSLRQRVTALQKTLPKLSDEDQATVERFERVQDFDEKRNQASKHADQIVTELQAVAGASGTARELTTELPKRDTDAVVSSYVRLTSIFEKGLIALIEKVTEERRSMSIAEADWSKKYEAARAARDAALEKLGAHRNVTDQIIRLRQQISELASEIADLQTELQTYQEPDVDLKNAVENLRLKNNDRAERICEWAREIEELSSGKIKASVNTEGDISEIAEAIDLIAAKTGTKEITRRMKLEDALKVETVADVRDRLRADCLSLLYWRQVGAVTGENEPNCENLTGIVGNTQHIRSALTENMDSTRVEAIAAAVSKPDITLTYSDGAREIAFEKASEGQRAAALLFMLLEQPGGPLIIDQPEGDLDNKIITELTEKLHSAKQNRQIVFASHNANIVVNGSSELVGHLDVNGNGERQFECSGAIDKLEVCLAITSTMEGGEKAFRDRHDKYGY